MSLNTMVRLFQSDVRGQRLRGASEGGSSCFNRGCGVRPFTGAAHSRLGIPVAFVHFCQLSESAQTKWLLQQLPEKTLPRSDRCLYKGSCSAYSLPLINHSYNLWCCCFSIIMTFHNTLGKKSDYRDYVLQSAFTSSNVDFSILVLL